MTKAQLYKQLHKIAKEHKVKCCIYKHSHPHIGACANPSKSQISIFIRPIYTVQKTISIFFHELGHIVAYRRGNYKSYYRINAGHDTLKKYAYTAERHTDRVGKKLMKKYFPKIKYNIGYKKADKKWLLEYYGV